jgi:hypothetical protein
MARPNPAIAQRKSDPHSTQIIVLGRVVACLASLVVTSTFFDIAGPPLAFGLIRPPSLGSMMLYVLGLFLIDSS